jgi:hypothetical protein
MFLLSEDEFAANYDGSAVKTVKCRSAVVKSAVFVPNWDRKSGWVYDGKKVRNSYHRSRHGCMGQTPASAASSIHTINVVA